MHIIFIRHMHAFFLSLKYNYIFAWEFARSQHTCPLVPQERHNMQRTSCPLGVALLSQSLQLWQHDCGGSTPPWSVLPCAWVSKYAYATYTHITSYNIVSTCIYMYYNILFLALTFRLQRFLHVLFALPFAFAANHRWSWVASWTSSCVREARLLGKSRLANLYTSAIYSKYFYICTAIYRYIRVYSISKYVSDRFTAFFVGMSLNCRSITSRESISSQGVPKEKDETWWKHINSCRWWM